MEQKPLAAGQEILPLGIVIERREIDNRWQKHVWRGVAVLPGAAELDSRGPWKELARGEEGGKGWVRYHAGTLPLSLFRKETEGYKVSMSQQPPRVFIVLRSGLDCDCEHDVVAVAATVSPYEAQDFLDSGSDIVEALPMPPTLAGFVQDYIDRHHSEEPFIKRQRGPRAPEKQVFVAQGAAPVERGKGKKRL
ncbi:MAG: DUF3305 domain-containing protein [Rhodovibrionaceae bacterium]